MNENESSEQASAIQIRQLIRRKLRKNPPNEENFLNIYPMMDMMTILLVFMVMQFAASSAAAIQQTEKLQIPYSTSKIDIRETVNIQISRDEVVVDGDRVLTLRNGQVDPSQKQGGGTGFLIPSLLKKMEQVRDFKKLVAQNNPKQPFTGEVHIIADRHLPFRTLSEVLYTLGQAEFSNLRFVVGKQGAGH